MEQELVSKIIRSKRRTLGLEITSEAALVIRAPMRAPLHVINQIIEKKRSWILEKQEEARQRCKPQRRYCVDEIFLYLGRSYPLKVVENWQKPFEFNGTEFQIGKEFLHYARRFFEDWYVKQAQDVIEPRVKIYAEKAGQQHSRITITCAKTRWGSCTSRRTLNFSWRLMMAPLDMIDYVVAHEVAHLEELNHSPRFWNKVKMLMPDFKDRQQWFKNNSHLLNL
jgi:predicted metal-dependent hydrolase